LSDQDKLTSVVNRLKLRTKVILMLLIVSLGPLLTAGFVNVNRAMDRGKKNAADHFANTTRLTANAFSDLFEHLQFELRSIARRFPAEDFDAAAIQRQLAAQPGLLPSLDQWPDAPFVSFAGRDFRTFFLALPDGEVYYAYPYRNVTRPVKLSAHDWFKKGLKQGGMMAGPIPALTGTKGSALVVAMPLFDTDKENIGYIGALVDTRRLQQVIGRAERDQTSENQGSFLLRTPDGLIMAHTDSKHVGRIAQGDVMRTASAETIEIKRGKKTLLVANWAVGKSGWMVARTAPTDHVYRFVHALIRVLIVVTVLTFLFILLLADYLAGLILRPIRELERGAQMIGAGALDYRIELDAHRADELGQLARSFNSMADNLQDTQSQIRAYGRSLETANQELDAMVYAITHDVRKSLRGISSYTRFLDDDFGEKLGDNGREMLNTISVNVGRITQLTDDLVSLVNAEREKAENEEFELGDILGDVRQRALERYQGEVLLCGDLPVLLGDKARLTLVFDHLVENGLKFNQHTVPCVEFSVLDTGIEYRLDVTDNGIGIPPSEHENIFALFAKLHPNEVYPGSGTGLNIARRIVADHRGRIDVSSVDGGGTRFSIFLPKDGSRLTSPGFRITGDGKIEPVR